MGFLSSSELLKNEDLLLLIDKELFYNLLELLYPYGINKVELVPTAWLTPNPA